MSEGRKTSLRLISPELALKALEQEGFKPQVSPAFSKHWQRLDRALAFNSPEHDATCFSYLSAKTKVSEALKNWGLLLIDHQHQSAISDLDCPAIFVAFPDAAMDLLLGLIGVDEWIASGAYQNPNFSGVSIEEGTLIGPHVSIGEGTHIESHCRIGMGVRIGKRCRVGSQCRIADFTVIGDDCQFTGQASIGGQGFGLLAYPNDPRPRQRRHVGRVVVGNRVRIGAQVAIDRGVFGDTSIGSYTALDNHIQIGHNCILGECNVICSMTGISGSSHLGDRVTLAGMVGVKDHVRIGSDVTLGGQSGVSGDLKPNQTLKGYPPKPLAEALKIIVLTGKLPELFNRLKRLEKLVKKGNANDL